MIVQSLRNSDYFEYEMHRTDVYLYRHYYRFNLNTISLNTIKGVHDSTEMLQLISGVGDSI